MGVPIQKYSFTSTKLLTRGFHDRQSRRRAATRLTCHIYMSKCTLPVVERNRLPALASRLPRLVYRFQQHTMKTAAYQRGAAPNLAISIYIIFTEFLVFLLQRVLLKRPKMERFMNWRVACDFFAACFSRKKKVGRTVVLFYSCPLYLQWRGLSSFLCAAVEKRTRHQDGRTLVGWKVTRIHERNKKLRRKSVVSRDMSSSFLIRLGGIATADVFANKKNSNYF